MIEETIIAYLSQNLTEPVKAEIPANPPQRFVVIQKKGSDRENHIDTALFEFDSYAESLFAAAELNEAVKAVVESLTDLDEISCCEFGGDYNATDTASKRYCYQAMYNITHY